jgi:hypothetical protein
MLNLFRPSFEMVKEGRILYNPKDITWSILVASETFTENGRKD